MPESFEITKSKGMFVAKIHTAALWGAIGTLALVACRGVWAERVAIVASVNAAASQAADARQAAEQIRLIQQAQNADIQRQLDDLKKSQAAMEDRIIQAIRSH